MLDRIKSLEISCIKDVVLMEGYDKRNNFYLIQMLLSKDINIHWLKYNKCYRFSKAVITFPEYYKICKHMDLHHRMIDHVNQIQDYDYLKGKRILLIKCNRNGEVMKQRTAIMCEPFIQKLEENGFIYINPEKMDMFEICIYLLNASTIVINDGSIVYTHFNFFNPKAVIIHLSLRGVWLVNGDNKLRSRAIKLYYNPNNIGKNYESIVQGIMKNIPERGQ